MNKYTITQVYQYNENVLPLKQTKMQRRDTSFWHTTLSFCSFLTVKQYCFFNISYFLRYQPIIKSGILIQLSNSIYTLPKYFWFKLKEVSRHCQSLFIYYITIEPGLELKPKISKMTPFLLLTVAVFYFQE